MLFKLKILFCTNRLQNYCFFLKYANFFAFMRQLFYKLLTFWPVMV